MTISASPQKTRVVVLTSRRSGASGVYRLMAEFVRADDLGTDPFAWSGPLRQISIDFHDQRVQAARSHLLDALAGGLFFMHHLDSQNARFNRMLAQALQQLGYKVIFVTREDEAQQVFSLMVAQHFDCWTRDDMARLRGRLAQGETVSEFDPQAVQRAVLQHQRNTDDAAALIAGWVSPVFNLKFESLYREGIDALALTDELFEFAGLPSRSSLISDESLLRHMLGGEHYTEALAQYSPTLRALRMEVAWYLSKSAGQDQPDAQRMIRVSFPMAPLRLVD